MSDEVSIRKDVAFNSNQRECSKFCLLAKHSNLRIKLTHWLIKRNSFRDNNGNAPCAIGITLHLYLLATDSNIRWSSFTHARLGKDNGFISIDILNNVKHVAHTRLKFFEEIVKDIWVMLLEPKKILGIGKDAIIRNKLQRVIARSREGVKGRLHLPFRATPFCIWSQNDRRLRVTDEMARALSHQKIHTVGIPPT